MKTYTAKISREKQDEHSFLVALIPAPSIPEEFAENKEVHIAECAVVAANHALDGKNKWAYVHLEADEKQTIGDALVAACAPMYEWVWCNLYVDGQDPLSNREEKLVEYVEFLLDYSRRIAQSQITPADLVVLMEIRKTMKEIKNGKE